MHPEEDKREKQIEGQGQRRAGDKIADIFQLAHPRDGVTDPAALEISQRQAEQMVEQSRAQLDIDAVGGVG